MKVNEFLAQERATLAEQEAAVRAAAPDGYMAMVQSFPHVCRREFLDWLGTGNDLPHDSFESILRRIASHNEVHDRGGYSPAFAHELADRWRSSHAHG